MEFNDSLEAQEFIDKLQNMLDDPRLDNWIAATEANYSKCDGIVADLMQAQQSFQDVVTKTYNAE